MDIVANPSMAVLAAAALACKVEEVSDPMIFNKTVCQKCQTCLVLIYWVMFRIEKM